MNQRDVVDLDLKLVSLNAFLRNEIRTIYIPLGSVSDALHIDVAIVHIVIALER